MTVRAKNGDSEHTPCVMIRQEPIAFTTEMTPKVDGGGYSVLPAQPRLQGRTMYSGTDIWRRKNRK